jgi:hypothetical protein
MDSRFRGNDKKTDLLDNPHDPKLVGAKAPSFDRGLWLHPKATRYAGGRLLTVKTETTQRIKE